MVFKRGLELGVERRGFNGGLDGSPDRDSTHAGAHGGADEAQHAGCCSGRSLVSCPEC